MLAGSEQAQAELAASHADLQERVAKLEGLLSGGTASSNLSVRMTKAEARLGEAEKKINTLEEEWKRWDKKDQICIF